MAGKRSQTDRSKPVYFEDGLILKATGLGRLLGCGPRTASKIARETPGFPKAVIWGRGSYGWSRLEVEAWLLNPTNPAAEPMAQAMGEE